MSLNARQLVFRGSLTLLLGLALLSGFAPPGFAAESSVNPGIVQKSAPKAGRSSARRPARRHARAVKTAALKPLTPQLDQLPVKSAAAPTADSAVKDLLAYGARKHKEGADVEAEDCFRQVLSRDPQNVDAFFNLGALAEGRGDLIVALGHYRAAHALNPADKQIGDAVISMEKALKDGGNSATRVTRSGFALGQNDPAGNFSVFPARPQGQNLFTPQGFTATGSTPVLLPTLDPPPAQDGQVFQLTGSQNAALAPSLGVQQSSATPPSLTVGNTTPPQVVAGRASGRSAARAAANMALNMGTSYALRAAGLHCPICHMVRFRF